MQTLEYLVNLFYTCMSLTCSEFFFFQTGLRNLLKHEPTEFSPDLSLLAVDVSVISAAPGDLQCRENLVAKCQEIRYIYTCMKYLKLLEIQCRDNDL